MRPSAAARTVSCGDDLAMVAKCFWSSIPSSASDAARVRVSGRDRDARPAARRSRDAAPRRARPGRAGRCLRRAESRAPAARLTRGSASSRASSRSTARCSSSRGMSATAAALTAGSAFFQRGCGLKRSRKDMEEPCSIGSVGPIDRSADRTRWRSADRRDRPISDCVYVFDSCVSHSAICSRVSR